MGDIEPSLVAAGSAFGWSIDGDPNRVVIGAYYGHGKEAGTGAVHVFHRRGIAWVIEAELIAPDGEFGDYFGSDVALNGNTILVGAFGAENDANTGAAYLFRRVQGIWQFQFRIDPPIDVEVRQFGYALDLEDDAAIISAFEDDHGFFSGRVFAYRLEDSSLELEAMLHPQLEPDAVIGWSVSLNQSRALLGAASVTSTRGVGAAYLFERDPQLGWRQTAKLESPTPSSTNGFGKSVSIRGNWAAVGSYHESATGHHSGAVHVYRLADSTWAHECALVGGDTASHDYFGHSVDLGDDLLVVGAIGKDSNGLADRGQGYTFGWSHEKWTQRHELHDDGMSAGDGLGFAVGIAGESAVISAASADAPATDSGRVLSFVVRGSDCNGNAVLDGCDIAGRVSADADANGVPDECQPIVCPWDCNEPPDDEVNVQDLLTVVASWGAMGGWTACDLAPAGGNGVVDIADLLSLIQAWGPCPP